MIDNHNSIERRPIVSHGEWLGWRQQDCTASTDIPALLHAHPTKTPLAVWASKLGLIVEEGDNAVLARGRWGEAACFEMLREQRPTWEIRRLKVYLRDPDARLGATPDAAAVDPEREGIGCIEAKTVTRSAFERHWLNGEPPLNYLLQAATAAMLMEASWICVAAIIMGTNGDWYSHIFDMQRNPVVEAKIRRAVAQFWEIFDSGRMPAVNVSYDAETISKIYPKALIKAPPLDLSSDNAMPELLVERATLKDELKTREKRLKEIDTDIKAKLGTHQSATLPGWRIEWPSEHVKEHLVKAFDRRTLRVSEVE